MIVGRRTVYRAPMTRDHARRPCEGYRKRHGYHTGTMAAARPSRQPRDQRIRQRHLILGQTDGGFSAPTTQDHGIRLPALAPWARSVQTSRMHLIPAERGDHRIIDPERV